MSSSRSTRRSGRPATTPEGRENQLVSLAYDLAERQLREGTASSQIVTQLLRAGSVRERLEHERIQNENLLLSARVDQIASQKRLEDLYADALGAMKAYTGQEDVVEYDNYEE